MTRLLLLVCGGMVPFFFSDDGSPIAEDEDVVFFPTFAPATTDGCAIPVHGWIYEPEESSIVRGVALRIIGKLPGIEADDLQRPVFRKRLRRFLVDNERGKQLSVRLGGKEHLLQPSEKNGHFRGSFRISAAELKTLAETSELKGGWLRYEAVTRKGDARRFVGSVQVVEPEGVSVISDLDDTIKVSEVTDKKALIRRTFLEQFQPVTGMADLYRRWEADGAAFHYVSSSPWQLYAPLDAMCRDAGFPRGSFHLKSFRVKDSSFLDLFASPEATKPAVIEPILAAFPKRRFIFVGDSGEKDPEVYGAIARKHPGQVVRILIRAVKGGENGKERFARAFRDLPSTAWQVFREPSEVKDLSVKDASAKTENDGE